MKSNSLYFVLCVLLFSACKTSKETTPYEFALLSAHVYDDEDQKVLPNKFEPFKEYEESEKGSFKLGSFLMGLDYEKLSSLSEEEEYGELLGYLGLKAFSTGGYFGRAYINTKTNELIIAHRGTDINMGKVSTDTEKRNKQRKRKKKKDTKEKKMNWSELQAALRDLDDDFDILTGRIPRQQLLAARTFTQNIRQEYRQLYQKEPIIIHTGHSLGAILAELCAVSDTCRAVTFESPGSLPFIEELQILTKEEYDLNQIDITVYNNRPNRINSLHPQLGKVIPLYAEEEVQQKGLKNEKILIENISGHSIDSLLLHFDARSGKPRVDK